MAELASRYEDYRLPCVTDKVELTEPNSSQQEVNRSADSQEGYYILWLAGEA